MRAVAGEGSRSRHRFLIGQISISRSETRSAAASETSIILTRPVLFFLPHDAFHQFLSLRKESARLRENLPSSPLRHCLAMSLSVSIGRLSDGGLECHDWAIICYLYWILQLLFNPDYP
jgi:hypothetical protein